VLTAVDKASSRINHNRPTPSEGHEFFKSVKADDADPGNISYDGYHKVRLFPVVCTKSLRVGPNFAVDDVLGQQETRDDQFIPFEHRESFTCARILGLLNIYGSKETHQAVYVHALKSVARRAVPPIPTSLRLWRRLAYRPRASCVRLVLLPGKLERIVRELRKRHERHEQLATLIEETQEWLSEEHGRARLVFPEWEAVSRSL